MSVFADPRVQEAARAFVPAADEVWRLQRGGDSECELFQRAVNGGKLITDNGTRQGIYVMTGAGKLLARCNSLKADRVLEMMEQGLAGWRALPEGERAPRVVSAPDGEERWELSRPVDGLVLTRVVRDLLPAESSDTESSDTESEQRARQWNRDALWFSRGEVDQFLAAVDARPGGAAAPDVFVHRLVSFALVDNVRGQCIPFEPNDVRWAELEARRIRADGGLVELELRGRTLAVEDGEWALGDNIWKPRSLHPHALETVLVGRATVDAESRRFTAFDLVGLGRRSGFTELNSRQRQPEPGAIGFAISLDGRAWGAAPAFIALYEGDWIRRPARGRELRKN